MAKDCQSKKQSKESNAANFNQKKDSDEEWKVKASITIKEDELALTVKIPSQINYKSDQTIDLKYSNHMNSDQKKL